MFDQATRIAPSLDQMQNKRDLQLVIFDCDGVLVDSERLTVVVEARVLTEMGWPMTSAEVVERFMGRSNTDVFNQVAERLGRQAAEEFDQVCTNEVIAAFKDRLEPIEGVAALVKQLHHAEISTCVASSGSHKKMRLTLGTTGLHDLFEGRIFSASEVDNGKPAPDLFLHAASQMGVNPTQAVVIEDSTPGVLAAAAAGMDCYGFAGGLTPQPRLEEAGAVAFETMTDLGHRLIDPT